MILTEEARTLLLRICEMADVDVDPIVSNIDLARSGEWTADEIREILDPYNGLYIRAVSRYEDLRPDEPTGVQYQLTEEGHLLCDLVPRQRHVVTGSDEGALTGTVTLKPNAPMLTWRCESLVERLESRRLSRDP